jgi:hypothetical protein
LLTCLSIAMATDAIVQVPYFQGIWRAGVTYRNPTRRRNPLRQEIQVSHPHVYDLSPAMFWNQYKIKLARHSNNTTVEFIVLLAGNMARDRVENKTCVFQYLLNLLAVCPSDCIQPPLHMSLRTETGIVQLEKVVRRKLEEDIEQFGTFKTYLA